MCGRYTLYHSTNEIIERFKIQQSKMGIDPRYNIAPSQLIAVVVEQKEGAQPVRTLEPLKWGLVPFWAKDNDKQKPFINARCETLAEKPSFKSSLTRKRCVIPADGFFEWKTTPLGKVPMYITLKSGGPFALAGIWEECTTSDGEVLRTCAIVTVPANSFMSEIHDRMPAILTPEAEEVWLNTAETDRDRLVSLLVPFDPNEMHAHPVGRVVNSPNTDSEECIKMVDQESIIADAMGAAGGRSRKPAVGKKARPEKDTGQLKIGFD